MHFTRPADWLTFSGFKTTSVPSSFYLTHAFLLYNPSTSPSPYFVHPTSLLYPTKSLQHGSDF